MAFSKEIRFQLYENILKADPDLLSKIRMTEEKLKPDDASGLYLYVWIPALVGFVQWVLKDAKINHRSRLYFLSRDGYQMYLIAKKINADHDYGIDCRYLNVSRYSMRIPEYHLSIDRAIDLMCVNGIDVSLKKILRRASLSEPEIREVVQETKLSGTEDKILNYQEVIALREQLKTSRRLAYYIEAYSGNAFESALNYLEKEGLFDDCSFALVDSGWVGTLQQSIEHLLRTENPDRTVHGYYFGIYEVPDKTCREQYHAYYFSDRKGLKRKANFANSLFETIVSADEGMTLRYELQDGAGYVPVKNDRGNPNAEQLRNNIHVLQEFLRMPGKTEADPDKILKITQQLFTAFMAHPTQLELITYGDDLFSDDIVDESQKKVAAELTDKEIRNQRFWNKLFILMKLKKAEIKESAWLEGSIVRNGKNIDSYLWHARFYKYFLYFRKQLKAL